MYSNVGLLIQVDENDFNEKVIPQVCKVKEHS